MKEILSIFAILLLSLPALHADEAKESPLSLGLMVIAGGRYDNLRMCVGSDAGVKGGPIADIMVTTRYRFSEKHALSFNLPVMRPILFGTAFTVLQFEPEFRFEFNTPLSTRLYLVNGPGLGGSFHYGPDYRSDLDNKGESFFAAGPFISYFLGISFTGPWEKRNVFGLRVFYSPLFSKEHSTGTVLGGALEYTFYFDT